MDRCTVLIADSDAQFVVDAARAFESHCDVSLAFAAEHALATAAKVLPDLVIVGYLGRGRQAVELSRSLREQGETADIPQLVVDVDRRNPTKRSWRREDGRCMEAEGYLGPEADVQTLVLEARRILEGSISRRNQWDEILRETQRRMNQQVSQWRHTLVGRSAVEKGAALLSSGR